MKHLKNQGISRDKKGENPEKSNQSFSTFTSQFSTHRDPTRFHTFKHVENSGSRS